jgi:hypothetical protein
MSLVLLIEPAVRGESGGGILGGKERKGGFWPTGLTKIKGGG